MCFKIIRMLRNLVLSRTDRLADSAHLEVQIRQSILQHARVRIGIQRQLVLLNRLRRIVRPAGIHWHVFIEMRQTIVIVGGRTVLNSGRRWSGRGSRFSSSRGLSKARKGGRKKRSRRKQPKMAKGRGTREQSHGCVFPV